MITLEQVRLLESKVTRIIDHVKKVTEENTALKEKLNSYQKRIDELEVMFQRFKEDQSKIAEGFHSVLNQLNQLEDASESLLSEDSPLSDETPANVISNLKPEVSEDGEKNPEPAGGELDIF